MSVFRQSRHPLVRWWWEMDRVSVMMVVAMMLAGVVAVSTASVAVAKTYNVGVYYFTIRQVVYVTVALGLMLTISGVRVAAVKKLGVMLFVLGFGGTLLTFVMGTEVKGARRWIEIAGQSVQPTEFLKPALIILTAWLLSGADGVGERLTRWQAYLASIAMMAMVAVPILMQPNFGMVLAMGSVWGAQVFMAGLPLVWMAPLVLGGAGLVVVSYTLLPHVRDRMERFLNPESSDTYQVDQAMEAISSGHLWGRGAGEGVVKQTLPDAHTDFIFAVIVEEFGIIMGLVVMALFLGLVWRGFARLVNQEDRFVLLAGAGLLTLIGLHVCVNVGVALHVLPTTGMTLPFMSYGGSSSLAFAIGFGFLLALLRKRKTQ